MTEQWAWNKEREEYQTFWLLYDLGLLRPHPRERCMWAINNPGTLFSTLGFESTRLLGLLGTVRTVPSRALEEASSAMSCSPCLSMVSLAITRFFLSRSGGFTLSYTHTGQLLFRTSLPNIWLYNFILLITIKLPWYSSISQQTINHPYHQQ